MSFINVEVRAVFGWPFDALYEDEDGSLGGLNNSIIMPPDSLNDDSMCSAVPNFNNAMRCPLSSGSFVRMGLNEQYFYGYRISYGPLIISDLNNHSIIVQQSNQEMTHPYGYMMVLRANQTYQFNSSSVIVSKDDMNVTDAQ